MRSITENNNPITEIPISKYDKFCLHLKNNITGISNLDIFKNKLACDFITQSCDEIFSEEITTIVTSLNNANIGIAALDIPEINSFDKATNAVFGAAVVIGIFNKIGKSNIDEANKTPFTLHTASHSSGKLLETTDHTPDAILGFHNDGLLNSGNLEIPNHIVLYNLYISYRQPGKFKWIPITLWDEFGQYTELAKSKNIKINLTPYFHLSKEGNVVETAFDDLEIPISNINAQGETQFFLNGKVLLNNNPQHTALIQAIRNSLEKNSKIISIDQKERRAFYLKNTRGFHARDIFKDPIKDVDLTRVFLRSVDINAEVYPSRSINLTKSINTASYETNKTAN